MRAFEEERRDRVKPDRAFDMGKESQCSSHKERVVARGRGRCDRPHEPRAPAFNAGLISQQTVSRPPKGPTPERAGVEPGHFEGYHTRSA